MTAVATLVIRRVETLSTAELFHAHADPRPIQAEYQERHEWAEDDIDSLWQQIYEVKKCGEYVLRVNYGDGTTRHHIIRVGTSDEVQFSCLLQGEEPTMAVPTGRRSINVEEVT